MTKNLGRIDKVIRTMTGLVFIYLGLVENMILTDALISNIFAVIGMVFLIVVIVGSCPLYNMIGLNTRNNK